MSDASPHALADAALAAGQFEEAAAHYAAALAAEPDGARTAALQHKLGKALERLGRLDEAEASYRASLQRDPARVDAYLDLGHMVRLTGRAQDALQIYQQSLAHGPHPGALVNIGGILHAFHQMEEAETSYKLALQLHPDLAEAHGNLANLYRDMGDTQRALAHYRRALAINPRQAEVFSNLLFALCFSEEAGPDAVYREHLAYNARFIAPLRAQRRAHARPRDPDRKLRIGYVTADARRHAGGQFLRAPFEHYDRTRFEVFVYFNRIQGDDWTDLMHGWVDHWCDCFALSDNALADRIVADEIDILLDCNGHMAGTRLPMFGLKPAPLQISFPIYPNTTGVETIDYRIMDDHLAPPGAESWHSETLIRLPDVHVCYAPFRDGIPPSDPAPVVANGYVTFASFNNFAKLGPATIQAWARILTAVPSARLRLKWIGLREHNAGWMMRRFAEAGLDPSRIDLIEWQAHPYPAYRDVDICLDPLFPNGGTTTCDALWMGVPVVTKVGTTAFARVGLCNMSALGLTDLIARDTDDYVRIATALAVDKDRLAALHRGLRERAAVSPLMDGRRYIKNLEAAYRHVWKDYCRRTPQWRV